MSVLKTLYTYKCPYIGCNAFYSKLKYLIYHTSNVKHVSSTAVKCPVITCEKLENIDKIWEECHFIEIHKFDAETVGNLHEIMTAINGMMVNASDTSLHCSNDATQYVDLVKSNLMSPVECNIRAARQDIFVYPEINTIFANMIKDKFIMVYDNGKYKCQIWGCNKSYKSSVVYRAHVNTHKHSIARTLLFGVKILDIDYAKTVRIFEKAEPLIIAENVVHGMYTERDWINNVTFVNDINKNSTMRVNTNHMLRNETVLKAFNEITPGEKHSVINKILYKNTECTADNDIIQNCYKYLNIKECIECVWGCSSKATIIVGTKPTFKTVPINCFERMVSRIYILDCELNIVDTIETDYGYARKIIGNANGSPGFWYILFSDGNIRQMTYEHQKYKFTNLDISQCVDLVLYNDETLFCTNGLVVYKVLGDKIIKTSEYFDSFINSICLRTRSLPRQDPTDIICMELETLRKKTQSSFVICNSVNGVIYSLDLELDNRISLLKNFYSHKVQYFTHTDTIIYTNHLYNTSRILTIHDTYTKTKKVNDKPFYSCYEFKNGIYFGGYDGTLQECHEVGKRYKSSLLFKFVKKNDVLLVLDTKDETDKVSENNYDSCIVNMFEYMYCLVVFLRCGVVFTFPVNHMR